MDRVEVLSQVLCPACGAILIVTGDRAVQKKSKGSRGDDENWEKTYIVDCGNQHCPDYRKVKFLKARYQEDLMSTEMCSVRFFIDAFPR